MSEERLINKRRFKVLQVPFDAVLELYQNQTTGLRLPDDAMVQDVRHSWNSDCFEFKINSGSYPELNDNETAERIQYANKL